MHTMLCDVKIWLPITLLVKVAAALRPMFFVTLGLVQTVGGALSNLWVLWGEQICKCILCTHSSSEPSAVRGSESSVFVWQCCHCNEEMEQWVSRVPRELSSFGNALLWNTKLWARNENTAILVLMFWAGQKPKWAVFWWCVLYKALLKYSATSLRQHCMNCTQSLRFN